MNPGGSQGDVIAIARPYVPYEQDRNGRHWLEYGSATIMVRLATGNHGEPAEPAAAGALLSQALSPQHPASASSAASPANKLALAADCELRAERTTLVGLTDHLRHVSVAVSVVSMSGNRPRIVPGLALILTPCVGGGGR